MDLGSVPDWIVAIAAALASWQGIKGLTAWRREEAGRRRMELAEVALSEFYEARDIFKWVRTPAADGCEPEDRSVHDDSEARIQAQRDIYYPILKRLADDGNLFGRMRARRYRVQAFFGPAGDEPYDIVNEVHGKVAFAAKTQHIGTPTATETALSDAWQDTVWDDTEEGDEVSDRIELAIQKAEEVFRPSISV